MENQAGISKSNAIMVLDTLQNLVANLNTTRDKNFYTTFVEGNDLSRNRALADIIYRFEWMSKIVDIPASDMTRKWRTWTSVTEDPTTITMIEAEERRLKYQKNVKEALTWGNLYGGCAIVLSVDGHGDASLPLDVSKITKGQLKRLIVIDRHRIFPQVQQLISEPSSPFFGEPELYMMVDNLGQTTQIIHRSRMVKFLGREAPYWPKKRLLWWGDSVLTRLYDIFKEAGTVISSIATMIHETNIDVITVEGLADSLASEGTEKVKERFQLLALMKAINGLMLLDGTEKYERKGVDFKQLPKIMEQFLAVLSAASDIPATRFLGKSPDGMNATGESDLVIYYDRISGQQENDLKVEMNYLDEVMIQSLLGKFPEDLQWTYNPLWQMTETQQADLAMKKTEVLLNLQALGVPDEVLLKDVQELNLSSNLDEDAIKKALEELGEVDEDDETKKILEGENDEPDEPDGEEANQTTEPEAGDA